ncbi:MAG: hypothetical protein JWR26_2844 [Pedosphaera sp.]|nr:hypothetical protein [Pedosphaera sp.]
MHPAAIYTGFQPCEEQACLTLPFRIPMVAVRKHLAPDPSPRNRHEPHFLYLFVP